MTETLTITSDMVGKYVRLRNGDKAYVSGIIPDEIKKSICPAGGLDRYDHFIGFWQDSVGGGVWREWSWKRSGNYIDAYPEVQNEHGCATDIMFVWVDGEPEEDNPLIEQTFKRIERLEDFQKSMTPSDYYPEAWRSQMQAATKRIEELEDAVKFLSGFSKGADMRMERIEEWILQVRDQLL